MNGGERYRARCKVRENVREERIGGQNAKLTERPIAINRRTIIPPTTLPSIVVPLSFRI